MANENIENCIDSDIVDRSPNKWLDLQSNYDLNAERVFDNDESTNTLICMAYTGIFENEDNGEEFQERCRPNSTPSSSNDTVIDSRNRALVNFDSVSNAQILNHALLRSFMRIKKGHVDNYIEHYDALQYTTVQVQRNWDLQLSRLMASKGTGIYSPLAL